MLIFPFRLFCVLAVVSAISSNVAEAAKGCIFYQGNTTSITFPANNLVSGKDVPIGTIVYEKAINHSYMQFSCEGKQLTGLKINSRFGAPPPTRTSVFPINGTNLGFSVTYSLGDDKDVHTLTSYGSLEGWGGGWGWSLHGPVTLSIIKISDSHEERAIISSGPLGKAMVGDLVIYDLNLSGDIQIVYGTCETPDIKVRMGDDHKLSEFQHGNELASVNFSIGLHQCPKGLKSIQYRLEKAPGIPLVNGLDGVIGLNSGSGAKGVGLKIMDPLGRAIILGKTYKVDGYRGDAGDFEIPLNASYVRLPGKDLEAGRANTEAIFIMSYL